MKKFHVIFENCNGNRYSYFIKELDVEPAIRAVYDRYISKMKLTLETYTIYCKYLHKKR